MRQKRARVSMANSDPSTSGTGMVDIAAFQEINKQMQEYDEKREKVIKDSRDTQKLSKQAIYCLHRGDFKGADSKLKAAMEAADKLKPIVDSEPSLRNGGSFSSAMEEWAEGMIFKTFLAEGRVATPAEMPALTRDEYLGGVLDFAGELNRHAVLRATERDVDAVRRCRDTVDALMGVFLDFDFRNGALRKKFDGLKYTLKKMETTLYEQSLTENLGFKRETEAEPAEGGSGGGVGGDE